MIWRFYLRGLLNPHNLHLPYLTDCILSHDIAVDAALKAWERSMEYVVW